MVRSHLGSHWYTFDARHNKRRIGRILIGRGRDAGDVPIIMAFGQPRLEQFSVVTDETTLGQKRRTKNGLLDAYFKVDRHKPSPTSHLNK
jgi:transglutaminase-like putative cysteine protease